MAGAGLEGNWKHGSGSVRFLVSRRVVLNLSSMHSKSMVILKSPSAIFTSRSADV